MHLLSDRIIYLDMFFLPCIAFDLFLFFVVGLCLCLLTVASHISWNRTVT